MKKAIFTAAALSLLMISCKKDRTCDCQEQTKDYDPTGKLVDDNITKWDYTIKKSTRRTAYNNCSHTYWEVTDPSGAKSTTDRNCSLK